MKAYPDPKSPWGKRLWYEDHEFSGLMAGALAKAGDGLFVPGRGIDIDRVLEQGFEIVPDYAADLPPDTLGRTIFHRDGRIEVHVQRTLAEASSRDTVARRRLRSTLAHELAHVVLHSGLHPIDTTASLFGYADPPAKVLCRGPGVFPVAAAHDWWEHQAYRGMACALIPATTLAAVLPAVLTHSTLPDALAAGKGKEVLAALADTFDTSFELTLYRVQDLGLLPSTTQRAIDLTSQG